MADLLSTWNFPFNLGPQYCISLWILRIYICRQIPPPFSFFLKKEQNVSLYFCPSSKHTPNKVLSCIHCFLISNKNVWSQFGIKRQFFQIKAAVDPAILVCNMIPFKFNGGGELGSLWSPKGILVACWNPWVSCWGL